MSRPSRTRARRLAVALTASALMLAGAQAADAASSLTIGFVDPLLANPAALPYITTPAQRSYWAAKAVNEGAGVVRVNLIWNQIAPAVRPAGFAPSNPASPGYDWSNIDPVVRNLAAHHLTMIMMLFWAPRWAEGPNMPAQEAAGSWEPDPVQFAAFATAAAIRYSGRFPDPARPGKTLPRVRYWQAWNEPNLEYYLSPVWTAGGQPNSPNLYRLLLNGFYRAVKAVNRTNFVFMAGTAPYGDPPSVHNPLGWRMRPLVFYRSLFCVNRALRSTGCPGPVYLDGIDHHPYATHLPAQTRAYWADDVSVPDIWKITRVLRAGLRSGHVLPAGPKRVMAGELTWDTSPPSTNGIAVPLANQACDVELGTYLLWRQGVDTVLWLQLRDFPAPANGYGTYKWGGMFFYSGAPKPSETALRFPLVAERISGSRVLVWGRSPAGGNLRILRQVPSGQWVAIAQMRVRAHQVFERTLRLFGHYVLAASVGGNSSLPWTHQSAACPS